MHRFVSICAPRTWLQGVVVFLLFEVAIQAVGIAFEASPVGTGAVFSVHEMMLTLFISSPFTVLVLVMLNHQANLQDQLSVLAATDSLTGLSNRRDFLSRMSSDPDMGAGVLMILDIDHFKTINDTFGHAYGDICLRVVADRLRDVAGDQMILGRLGGEEFAVFCPNATMDVACGVATRLTDGYEMPGQLDEAFAMTTSVGLARGHRTLPVEMLLDQADEAMYQAKAAGRSRICIWSPVIGFEAKRPMAGCIPQPS